MKCLDEGCFEFTEKEYPLIRGILRSAQINIETREDKDADDRAQLRIIQRMLANVRGTAQ